MRREIKESFAAAGAAFPVKLFKQPEFARGLVRGFVTPIHIQWIPTNVCNADCSFCSCRKRDRRLSLDIDRSRAAIETFAQLGTRAVTITGGGEPTLYKHFRELIHIFAKNRIEIGLVSNGLNYQNLDYDALSVARWWRMSISDEYAYLDTDERFSEQIEHITRRTGAVDFALSYVVTQSPNADRMRIALNTANKYSLTHIRFVQDICDARTEPFDFDAVFDDMDTSRAIMQTRRDFDTGFTDCWISLAKPIIGADGKIYPCCGTQYASSEMAYDNDPAHVMGDIEDAADIWAHQFPFTGTNCARCYYGGYIRTIGAMREPARHIDFI